MAELVPLCKCNCKVCVCGHCPDHELPFGAPACEESEHALKVRRTRSSGAPPAAAPPAPSTSIMATRAVELCVREGASVLRVARDFEIHESKLRRAIIAVKQSREIGARGRPPVLTAEDCAELMSEETAQSTLTKKNKFHEKLAQKARTRKRKRLGQ